MQGLCEDSCSACTALLISALVHVRDQLSKTLLSALNGSFLLGQKKLGSGQIAEKEPGQGRKWAAEEDKMQKAKEPLHQASEKASFCKKDKILRDSTGREGANEPSKISMQTAAEREMRPMRETPGPHVGSPFYIWIVCGSPRRISEGYS